MATINKDKILIIKQLYSAGLSTNDIAKKLRVSIDAVYYFFRKHNIKRRNFSEARKACYNNQTESFVIKNNLSSREKELKVAGIMLYWGEGSKWTGEKIVDFANSDAGMIMIFLKFLRIICGIKEKKLRAYLYCYSNQKPEEMIKYWVKVTGIPASNFTKPYIREDFQQNKIEKMRNGLIHIRYGDKKLLDLLRSWIEEYKIKLK